ncbi:MAG: hypothetical protein IK136_01105 [Oscillospiraceae bacterium]|nr:hypothetical protein [Oscillospiraceae bacterium]
MDNNTSEKKKTYRKPRTLDELRAFCERKGMPLEKMRFFIGENVEEARAFGVYRCEDGDFIVYKNKADGSRYVRYKGADEAFAVNELYEKLKAETEKRRASPSRTSMPRTSSSSSSSSRSSSAARSGGSRSGAAGIFDLLRLGAYGLLVIVIIIGLIAGAIDALRNEPDRGYYSYGGRQYYYNDDDWYGYDAELLSWVILDAVDDELAKDHDEYYLSGYYDSSYGCGDFAESGYPTGSSYYDDDYEYDEYYDSDDDYDWSWGDDGGWDSWDSGGTDWDSDW